MAFKLDKIVPWGRSFNEYVLMFSLSKMDLRKKILDCGSGPASFNSILTKRGGRVISVDPLYKFSAKEIQQRINETYDDVLEQAKNNMDEFVWNYIGSVEELGRVRTKAMKEFLSDYPDGLREGRYKKASLPALPFEDKEFDIGLCSHLLFLYSEQLSKSFHISSIKELCRVAKEVRIFPLLELGAEKSRHLDEVISTLKGDGFDIAIEKVEYEFQKSGNKMLRVRSGSCSHNSKSGLPLI